VTYIYSQSDHAPALIMLQMLHMRMLQISYDRFLYRYDLCIVRFCVAAALINAACNGVSGLEPETSRLLYLMNNQLSHKSINTMVGLC
jgi:hypothetical protein